MVDIRDFELIFEQTPLALLLIDKQMKNIRTNGEFTRLTGISREQVLSLKITDFKDKGLIKYLRDTGETFADAISQKRVVHGQSTLDTPAGRIEVLRTIVPLLDEKGDLQYVYIAYNDITKTTKMANYMAHEVDELAKIYGIMAKGDLTPRYQLTEADADTRELYDLLAKLRDGVRGIIGALQNNIKDVNRKMQDLTSTADNATTSVEDASKSVAQIAKSSGVVSENTTRVSQAIDQAAKAMQDMSAAVQEITSNMENVSGQANNARDAAKTGALLTDNVNKGMTDIAKSSENVYTIVKDIEKQMADISKIIVLIRDLANQTNLLALNAAIEAARAGEHGRGFAVVASEVKSLAQESRTSAERIEEMIKNLNASTKNANDAMESTKGLVVKGTSASAEALEAFRKIQVSVETVAKSATEVAAATEEQAATTEEITASINDMAKMVEETAKEAGDTAAAAEESSAAIDEITRMIRTVDKTATEAMDANRKFKVE
ncbi:MAG TPA: methyl-accepting chemotaxis protein [Methanoregulaceae archaeon]|nr:methyl-accepting chemotaxis protein [Methanoregulaceae archaeon]HPD76094.1 methyl-accepting chemotaxis protein [Methanoregulaceae archaeon]HRY75847.1 methyl-accepting chemotaxis protein [Methanoregulaceae archaeon]